MNHVYICIYESGSNMIHIYICKSLTYNHSSYIYRHIYNHLPYTDMYINMNHTYININPMGLFPHTYIGIFRLFPHTYIKKHAFRCKCTIDKYRSLSTYMWHICNRCLFWTQAMRDRKMEKQTPFNLRKETYTYQKMCECVKRDL